jgi:hypothetical protein
MATTTNYGWDTPDDTDLVKDGADAIRELGQDIDTSLFGITGGKNVGLVHLNTTTVTASNSTTISNVFSSAYDNYRVILRGQAASGQVAMLYNNTLAGTPAAGAGTYVYSSYFTAGNAANGTNFQSTGATSAVIAQITDATDGTDCWSYDIVGPALARRTTSNFTGAYGSGMASTFGGFLHGVATAYDGFRISTSGTNWTGSISVFGYRK